MKHDKDRTARVQLWLLPEAKDVLEKSDHSLAAAGNKVLLRYEQLIESINLPEFTGNEWHTLLFLSYNMVVGAVPPGELLTRAKYHQTSPELIEKLEGLDLPQQIALLEKLDRADLERRRGS